MRYLYKAIFLILLSVVVPAVANAQKSCKLDNYIRIGTPWDSCAADRPVFEGGLCYKACPAGWKGVGHECYAPCPGGYRDDGLHCAKPPKQYAGCPQYYRDDGQFCAKPDWLRSKFYAWQAGDPPFNYGPAGERCRREFPGQGCYQNGLIWYPNACPAGWQDIGVSCKKPDPATPGCPAGYQDIGVSCKKPDQNRGVGIVKNMCSGGKERVDFLCYDACRAGYKGTAHVCGTGQCPPGTQDKGGWCCAGADCAPPPPQATNSKNLASLAMPANLKPDSLAKCVNTTDYIGKIIKSGQSPAYYVNPRDNKRYMIYAGAMAAGCEIPPIESAIQVGGDVMAMFPEGESLANAAGITSKEQLIERCRAIRGLPVLLRGGALPNTK